MAKQTLAFEDVFPTTKPVDMWLNKLASGRGYWPAYKGTLREEIFDPQVCGYAYSILGVLCRLFLEHADSAKEIQAHWEGCAFCWTDAEGTQRETEGIPRPLIDWVNEGSHNKYMLVILAAIDADAHSWYGRQHVPHDAFAMIGQTLQRQCEKLYDQGVVMSSFA